jgi:hypothetical protein
MSTGKKSGKGSDKTSVNEAAKPTGVAKRTPEAVQAMIDSMTLEKVPIDTLHEFDMNPRSHGDDVNFLVNSISGFGWTNPILAQRGTGRVIAGHGRLAAAKAKGLKILPVIFLDYDDATATAYTIADNASAEHSEWDFSKLDELLAGLEIEGFSKEDVGVTDEMQAELDKLGEDLEEKNEPVISKGGNYESQFGVIVICDDESEQERVYGELQEAGYKVKVVVT